MRRYLPKFESGAQASVRASKRKKSPRPLEGQFEVEGFEPRLMLDGNLPNLPNQPDENGVLDLGAGQQAIEMQVIGNQAHLRERGAVVDTVIDVDALQEIDGGAGEDTGNFSNRNEDLVFRF